MLWGKRPISAAQEEVCEAFDVGHLGFRLLNLKFVA